MSKYVETPSPILNPRWTGRNQTISKHIAPNSSVLDLGCGAKDLLNYATPAKYIGIDYYTNEYADIKADFNTDFELPEFDWDYIVCSGLIEYLSNVDRFLSLLEHKSKYVIITFWSGAKDGISNPNVIKTVKDFDSLFCKHFQVESICKWSQHHIYVGINR